MDEGRPISIGGSRVLLMACTTQRHLFTAWSGDDAATRRTAVTPAPNYLGQIAAMLAAGNRSELVSIARAIHTYMFKSADRQAETVRQLDAFLGSLGFLPAAVRAR
jgi:hypothetical protein